MSFFTPPTTLVSAAKRRRFATKKSKRQVIGGKNDQDRIKNAGFPTGIFEGLLKTSSFLTAPFLFSHQYRFVHSFALPVSSVRASFPAPPVVVCGSASVVVTAEVSSSSFLPVQAQSRVNNIPTTNKTAVICFINCFLSFPSLAKLPMLFLFFRLLLFLLYNKFTQKAILPIKIPIVRLKKSLFPAAPCFFPAFHKFWGTLSGRNRL